MLWSSNQHGHVWLYESVIFGLAMFKVTKRCDKDGRIIGYVCCEFSVANGVRLEAVFVVW
jgi:hypothetical protein